ncbi:MAG: hypothetical protein AB8A49_04845 [Prochlorococcus sp.]
MPTKDLGAPRGPAEIPAELQKHLPKVVIAEGPSGELHNPFQLDSTGFLSG